MIRSLLTIALLATFLLNAEAATTLYYVDSQWAGTQTGAAATPWKSIQWSTVNSSLAANDVTVYFTARQAGSDVDQVYSAAGSTTVQDPIFPYLRTDTSTHVLTLDGMSFYNISEATPSWSAQNGVGRCVTDTINWQDNSLIKHSYITIRGFKVIATSSRKCIAINGDNCIVESNNCSHAVGVVNGTGPGIMLTPTADAGHQGSSQPSAMLTNIFIRYNEIHDTAGEAVYLGGAGSGLNNGTPVGNPSEGYPTHHHVFVQTNFIHDVGTRQPQGDGIDMKAGLWDFTIEGNTVSNLTDSTGGGIRGFVTQGLWGTNSLNTLRNNRFYLVNASSDAALAFANSWGKPQGWNVYNNIIYKTSGSGTSVRLYSGCSNIFFQNNTVVSNGNAFAVDTGVTYGATNNIFLGNSASIFSGGTPVHDYNVYSGTLGDTANTHDTSSTVAANLNNVASLDFSLLTTAPAKNAGFTISSITTDIIGTTRPQGSAYDIGAYEYPQAGGGGGGDPAITVQPSDQTVIVGNSASFSVTATGTAPLAYAWYKNGTLAQSGASSSYSFTSASADNGAAIYVIVTSAAPGNVQSRTATLIVNNPPPPGSMTIQSVTINTMRSPP